MGTTETALLAGGCFWGVEEIFRAVPGVIDSTVGYTGGNTDNPTYESVKTGTTGHAEAIEVVFDPLKISYTEILKYFFRLHDPTQLNQQQNDRGTQYRSAVFYFNEAQKSIAEQLITEIDAAKKWDHKVVTQVVKATTFYKAEDYHQDYLQKNPSGYNCHFLRD